MFSFTFCQKIRIKILKQRKTGGREGGVRTLGATERRQTLVWMMMLMMKEEEEEEEEEEMNERREEKTKEQRKTWQREA